MIHNSTEIPTSLQLLDSTSLADVLRTESSVCGGSKLQGPRKRDEDSVPEHVEPIPKPTDLSS